MKKKHFKHCDFIKVNKDVVEHTDTFKNVLITFLSQPILFKDKRRNPELYEIKDLGIYDNYADDFEKMLITVVRSISYKTNK